MNIKPPEQTWRDIPEGYEGWHIKLKFQHGPVRECGVNGCQINDVIAVLIDRLNAFQKIGPCRENALAITKLEEAIHWLDHRNEGVATEGNAPDAGSPPTKR
jgi:hypothetical protein